MPNVTLSSAKKAKNDEFYTQYADIQKEVNAYLEFNPDVFRGKTVLLPCDDPDWSNFTKFFAQNFKAFGLRKLISTSFALDSKPVQLELFPSRVEEASALYDPKKTTKRGKLFILDHDTNADGKIDIEDLQMTQYLKGNGDFRSPEVTKLRDEADLIITNPPFSLFRDFMAWIMEANKKFLVIANMNAITYKEIFPLIMHNQLWMGNGFAGGNAFFRPVGAVASDYAGGVFDEQTGLVKFRNCCWLTNLDHGRRHQPLSLMTMADNIKFSKHKEICGFGYQKYDNYDAIEVPFTDAIPADWDGAMRMPASARERLPHDKFEFLPIKTGAADDERFVYVRMRGGYDASCSTSNTYDAIRLSGGRTAVAAGRDGRANLLSGQVLPRAIRDCGAEPDLGQYGDHPAETGSSERRTEAVCDCGWGTETPLRPDPNSPEERLRAILTAEYGCRDDELQWLPNVMGVPISFLDKFCPEQFEIVGISKTWFGMANKVYPEQTQVSADGRRSQVTKLNDGPVLALSELPDHETYYLVDDNCYTQTYARIFIRRKG